MNKKIIHSVFENISERFPEHIAVEEETNSITYTLLNRQANRIAWMLLEQGLVPKQNSGIDNAIIGIFLPAGMDYISSIIGVSKAGGIFLPLDIEFPEKRLYPILNKTMPKYFITNHQLKDTVIRLMKAFFSVIQPAIDHSDFLLNTIVAVEDIIHYSEENPDQLPDPDSGNYIIFTSGSTGEPKAILGCHKSLSHFIHWEIAEFGINDSVRVSQFAPTTFDVSFRDMFVPLLSGGTVCIPSRETALNARNLLKWMEKSQLTLVHCVPSLFRLIMKEIEVLDNPKEALPALKHFLLAGEAVYGSDVIRWFEMMGNRIELVNIYGPSETTLAKAFNRITEKPTEKNRIMPIGKPISNTAILILKDNRLCRIDEIGEIHIKTPFRSKGYVNDPEATNKSFIQNPLTPDTEDMIYKTGDMGKYLADRSVAFIGRLDRQVKVSGIRIELDEIESIVRNYEHVDQGVVMAYKTPEHEYRLVCYYTEKKSVDISAFRSWLLHYLPNYMIPSFFVRVKEFNLNINGKIDRKALPRPEALMYETIQYAPAANETEAKLADMWKEVLNLETVGVNHPFFEIGGNSLSAIRIISKIFKTFGTEITIRDFFDHSTVRKLSEKIIQSKKSIFLEIPELPKQPLYDLSHAQRRLWILDQMEGGGIAYTIPSAYKIEGDLNITQLQKAFNLLIQRHESLRTRFIAERAEPKQQILDVLNFTIEEIDLTLESNPESKTREYAATEMLTPFDLSTAPLFRVKLFKLDVTHYILLLNIHHIISDAWSLDVLAKDVLVFYESAVEEKQAVLPPLRIHYKDFSAWQNHLMASDTIKIHRDYWHQKLSGELDTLNLPLDFTRPPVQTFNGSLIRFNLDDSIANKVIQFSKTSDATLFMILLSILKILLYRYSGGEDKIQSVIIGSPISGRNHIDLEHQIGLYINMLPLRDEIHADDTFSTVLDKVKKTTTEAYDHQIYPFDMLVDELNLSRDVSHSPIFDVGMTLHTDERIESRFEQKLSGKIKISEVELEWQSSKYDLIFIFIQSGNRLCLDVNFNTDLFTKNTITRIENHLEVLMTDILEDTNRQIRYLNILTDSEKQQVLVDFNSTVIDYPKDKTITDLFEAWVTQTPNQPAVMCDDIQWSYSELNAKAESIAGYFSESVHPEEIIGVMVDRSEFLIAALLGILKSGAAYLPIDPNYPQERINYIIEDSNCQWLLTQDSYMEFAHQTRAKRIIDLHQIVGVNFNSPIIGTNQYSPHPSSSLAYVIYTSGSTGKPKGVLIEHQGLINMSLDQIRSFGIQSSDHVLQFSSASFDASLYEIFMALFAGATLVISGRNRSDNPESFNDYLMQKRVTTVTLPPVFLNTLNKNLSGTVKNIITAGEPAIVADALFYSQTRQYINAYGPTEASVCVAFHRVDPHRAYRSGIPIGKPLSNTQLFILDETLQPVPIGIAGEICVSGVGLARGYLNRDELTQQKFIPHPFYHGEKLYKTGDIGKWLTDGTIEFLGRKDDQVKIRGYRIELEEIEHALKQNPDISDTLVIDKKRSDTEKELIAYFTTHSKLSFSLNSQHLRSMLGHKLPEYMIPAHFIHLEKFPLTPHGKIDRNALPNPNEAGLSTGTLYIAPHTDKQVMLTEIWESVLGRKIGIHDNYFASGGDSIKAIQIVSRLREKNYKIDVIDLFRYPTIDQLTDKLILSERITDQRDVFGEVPLTAIQSWFFKTFTGNYQHFNQAVLLSAHEELSQEALYSVFQAIQTHHDALRMAYHIQDHRIIQNNLESTDYPIKFERITVKNTDEMLSYASTVQQSINLINGPLMKAVLFHVEETHTEKDRLLIVIHHLVVDTVSWRILIEDIATAYQQVQSGQPIQLPSKTDSFKSWAEAVHACANSEALLGETEFWMSMQSDSVPKLRQDRKSEHNLVQNSQSLDITLSEKETDTLLTKVHYAYTTTMNDILLTALSRAIYQWQGIHKIQVMLEGHGRESLSPYIKTQAAMDDIDISRTVGWFTSIYPVIIELSVASDIGYQIKYVKELLRKIPSHGMGYGILNYIANRIPPSSVPQISFNYLGQFDTESYSHLFQPAHESVGNSVSPMAERFHDIDISGSVIQGKMELSITFNPEQFNPETMQHFLEMYTWNLQAIANHCASKQTTEITPSDLTFKGLSLEELEAVYLTTEDTEKI
ncbi:MAG: amino acid adenylation domain-containing protein [Desulfobacterales bacterium]|nr:amino acid adenylation domain-containing protein [Desulfobacterales bacterium]